MELMMVDPRALKENPDQMRRSKSSPQADALLLASIKAVGIVQPPVILPARDGGNGYVIHFGHRRVAQAIAADLTEIRVLVADSDADHDAMRALVENVAREPLNPVDLWRSIERLVALGWTEESIALALALPVRQVRKLRLLANVLPAMLDQMSKGDMPGELQLRVIAAASIDEQSEVWKKYKPRKADPQVSWHDVARALTKTRMYARHANFDDALATAYGITWVEDLFAPADEDSRYTTDVEAFLGAQNEWMTNHLPKRGTVIEVNEWGQPKLPAKAERIWGKPGKSDCSGWYLDRDGQIQSVAFRVPQPKKAKDKASEADETAAGEIGTTAKPRPDLTRKGMEMIGDLRTDALHEALAPGADRGGHAPCFARAGVRRPERLHRLRQRRRLCANWPTRRATDRGGRQTRLRSRHPATGRACDPDRRAVVPGESLGQRRRGADRRRCCRR
jgi:ParB family chromosome partitioning protein